MFVCLGVPCVPEHIDHLSILVFQLCTYFHMLIHKHPCESIPKFTNMQILSSILQVCISNFHAQRKPKSQLTHKKQINFTVCMCIFTSILVNPNQNEQICKVCQLCCKLADMGQCKKMRDLLDAILVFRNTITLPKNTTCFCYIALAMVQPEPDMSWDM